MAGEVDQQADSVPLRADELALALVAGDRALYIDGDLHSSRRAFERAYQLAAAADDVTAIAQAALGLAGLWVSERRTVSGAAELEARLRQVLPRLPAGGPLALRVRARLAAEADYRTGRHAAITAVLEEIRADPGRDPVPLAEALSLAHHCVLGPDDFAARRELAAELITVSFRTGRRGDLLMGLLWRTADAFAEGDPHAERLLGELRDQLGEQDHLAIGFVVSAIEVMLAIRAGRLDVAETLVANCAKSGAAAGDVDNEWWPGAQLVTIRWYQGRLAELLPMLLAQARSTALSSVDDSSAAALAVAAALHGDRRTAASALAALAGRLADGPDDGLARSSSWLVTMNGIVEAAFLLDDAGTAARAYELLRPYRRLPMVGSLGITCFGSAEHALGVAALVGGEVDRSIEHLRAAVRHNLALGHWPAVLASRRRLAEAYGRRGLPADAAAVRRELELAAGEAAGLGSAGGPATVGVAGSAGADSTEASPTGSGTVDAGSAGPGSAEASSFEVGSAGVVSAGLGSDWAGSGSRVRAGGADELGAGVAHCRRAGRRWRVTLGDRQALVEDSVGMAHLAVLVGNPRQEIAAAELVAGLAGLGAAAGLATASGLGGVGRDAGTAQPVLDRAAIGAYKSRLDRLNAEIEQLESGRADEPGGSGDPGAEGRVASAREERDWLASQLAAATGLGSRTRSFSDQPERARVAVGKAIRRALARITEADPVIGEHLAQAVRTGVRCSYWPS